MDGIHDLGGKHGFGPLEREVDEPVFHERWEAVVFPTPTNADVLFYRYKVQVSIDPSTNVYFRGGPMIANVIEQSCLAVAEQRYGEDGSREQTELFEKALMAAIEADKEAGSLPSLGQDQGGELTTRSELRQAYPIVTINGVEM